MGLQKRDTIEIGSQFSFQAEPDILPIQMSSNQCNVIMTFAGSHSTCVNLFCKLIFCFVYKLTTLHFEGPLQIVFELTYLHMGGGALEVTYL